MQRVWPGVRMNQIQYTGTCPVHQSLEVAWPLDTGANRNPCLLAGLLSPAGDNPSKTHHKLSPRASSSHAANLAPETMEGGRKNLFLILGDRNRRQGTALSEAHG